MWSVKQTTHKNEGQIHGKVSQKIKSSATVKLQLMVPESGAMWRMLFTTLGRETRGSWMVNNSKTDTTENERIEQNRCCNSRERETQRIHSKQRKGGPKQSKNVAAC